MANYDATQTNRSKRSVRIFSDLNLNFTRNPATKDVARLTDVEAVKRAVRNLILTNRFERPFHPEIYGGLYEYLFEPLHPFTATSMQHSIEHVINTFEPRVRVEEVTVTEKSTDDGYDILIIFTLINTEQLIEVEFFLERLR